MLIPACTKLLMVDVQSHCITKPPRNYNPEPNCEDAHFIYPEKQVIGVADGVGGWAINHGIDAGEYARELMKNAEYFVNDSQIPTSVDPKSVLIHAYNETKKRGSSTACIIALHGNCLRAANLGDSGFLVIRRRETIYRSQVQQHGFNTPYQIGILSTPDSPERAEEMEVEVESGDIIVAATDGLFDNLFPSEIEATVERCLKYGNLMGMAHKLAEAAHRNSLKRDTVSPFSMAAINAGHYCIGGKPDDITVVVACVEEEDLEDIDIIV